MSNEGRCTRSGCTGKLVEAVKERTITTDATGDDPNALNKMGRTVVKYSIPPETLWICTVCLMEHKSLTEG